MRAAGSRVVRLALGLGALALTSFGGCSDTAPRIIDPDTTSPDTGGVVPQTGALVSDPRPAVTAGAAAQRSEGIAFAATLQSSGEPDIVYVALPPRSVGNGVTAVISGVRGGDSVKVRMSDGGFDPVPFAASVGDVIQIEVRAANGASVALLRYAVPPRRRPKVVRTVPPRGKTDVAINSNIIIVFSEPVAEATLSASSVRLFRGTSAVAGAARLLDGAGTTAVFDPTESLAPNTEYQLRVTQAVRDLQGDELEAEVTTGFRTGLSSTGPPASISIAPDTVYSSGVAFPETYQLAATVQDAAGNILVDDAVTWSSSNPSGLAVSGTGLVTALASGDYVVTASVGQLLARAAVYVRGVPASLEISPSPVTVYVEEIITLAATVRDASGFVIDAPVIWSSNAPAVARVASVPMGAMLATVIGVTAGSATINATSAGVSRTTSVTVGPRRAITSVSVSPAARTLIVGETKQLTATPTDANGAAIGNRPITWASDNSAVATVGANGQVAAVGVGTARVTATSEGVSGTTSITVTTLNFASLSAGDLHNCGLTTEGAAYCWGARISFESGLYGYASRPIPVLGGVEFASLAAGAFHTCGLTTDGTAYCWGSSELGDGTDESSETPVPVTGGLTFGALTAAYHTCGLTTTGEAYCWGRNDRGHLGDGSTTMRLVPTRVAGGLTFESLAAGSYEHTCGLTSNGDAYCWGRNGQGELGNGSTADSHLPVRVRFALGFTAIVAGGIHTCGIAPPDAYCWGTARVLGNAVGASSLVPRLVEGGHTFTALSAGVHHTCGLTNDGSLYCWGRNGNGELGNGTTSDELLPTRVVGGIRFSSVSAGMGHTCALSTDGIAYCWGNNRIGELGAGFFSENSTVPVKVVGQR
jgi:alpha-tubulin suppressor-like RCC1 family protein